VLYWQRYPGRGGRDAVLGVFMISSNRDKAAAGVAPTTWVLGLPVHQVDLEAVVAQMTDWIENARVSHPGTSSTPVLRHVVTLNPEMVMAAQRDPVLATSIIQADLTTADGVGITFAARLQGQRIPRVTGIDLLEGSARLAAEHGYRLFLLGAPPGVAAAAALQLAARYPALYLPGSWSGSPEPGSETGILEQLAADRPDILFVAFGSPAQERWISQLRDGLQRAGVCVAVGVGGSFDFISGQIPRAPLWMRRVGLEWVYRLLREPWRWRRMSALPRFALAVLRSWAVPPA
jgi:N-acetylglucosaminyldiphosphoundecaprenol N-acetyl-beta-D-mannosaminyltransferase